MHVHVNIDGRVKSNKSFPIKREVKGTGHFFETLSVGSVSGTDHS